MRNALLTLTTLACLFSAGCGVQFVAGERGTEFFTSMEITGTKRAGEELTLLVGYEQYYPVDVEFICEVRKSRQLINVIGRDIVPALPGGGPEATPFPGAISFDFVIREPGRYRIECLTEADDDNFIAEFINIAAAEDGAS